MAENLDESKDYSPQKAENLAQVKKTEDLT